MDNVEQLLRQRKKTLDALAVPEEELAARLSRALKERKPQRRERKDARVQRLEILDQEVLINQVYAKDGNTYVTITTDESTVLTRVFLMADGQRVELQKTVTEDMEKLGADLIRHTRTLHFPGTGEKLYLRIEETAADGAKTARVLRGGEEVDVPVDTIEPGDVMVIRPGEKIPTEVW